MNYQEREISNALVKIKYQAKRENWAEIKALLFSLWYKAFTEGIYLKNKK